MTQKIKKTSSQKEIDQRSQEFLACLGRGKTIHEIESEEGEL